MQSPPPPPPPSSSSSQQQQLQQQRKRTSSQALAMYQAAALHGWRSGGGGAVLDGGGGGGGGGGSSGTSSSVAAAAAAAAASACRGGTITDEEAALLLQQHHSAMAAAAGGGVVTAASAAAAAGGGSSSSSSSSSSELKLTRELIECLAMAQGVHEGLAGLGVDAATYEYMPNRHYIRSFSSAIPIPFSVFDGIRHSKHEVKMTATQEENVMKAFDKMVRICTGSSSSGSAAAAGSGGSEDKASSNNASLSRLAKEVSASLPFVSAFIQQYCPELRSGVLSNARGGTTYLLLAVVTGHRELAQRCLDAGASANHLAFLRDPAPPPGEMYHGYSPLFVAVLAERVDMLEALYAGGGDVRVYDRWGRTPLHAAVAMNSKEVVQWLLGKGAPRYVGDCFNITPAEGADDEYYAMLAMPNVSLHGTPKERSRCVVLAPSSAAQQSQQQQQQQRDKHDATSPTAAATDDSDNKDAAAGAAAAAVVERNEAGLCHCHSGRPSGYCGCVDDMFVRWTADRLSYTWCPGVDFAAIAQRQLAMDVKARPPAGLMRRRI